MKILFAGGGTGGHVLPIISIVRELKLLHPGTDLNFFYIGPKDPYGALLLSQEGVKVKTIIAGKIRRYGTWKSRLSNALDIFIKIPFGITQSLWHIFFIAPDALLSKGGYGSFPAVVACFVLQIPIFLHESDVAPGLAEKVTSKLALEIFVSFPKTEYFSPQKSIITGNPIRRELLEGSVIEAQKKFGLQGGRPVIFIIGGSQGSQRINDVILAALPNLIKEFEIIHQTGEANIKMVKAESEVVIAQASARYFHAVSFLREQDLRHVYKVADLIIARAGSGSIFEIAAEGKPSILIPLPEAAQDHQYKNAYTYAAHGAAMVLEEANLYPHFLLERIQYLFQHPDELTQMKEAARHFASPRAGQVIAEYILDYLTQK